jgi:hypothetical protein
VPRFLGVAIGRVRRAYWIADGRRVLPFGWMGANRDKALDLENTRRILRGEMPPVSDRVNWLGRKKGSGAYDLDLLLLEGLDESRENLPRGGIDGHISALRHKHGLAVERDARGLWKITGEAYIGKPQLSPAVGYGVAAKTVKVRNPITEEQYRRGYELGRDVFQGKTTKVEAIGELVALGTNKTSGSYMLQITRGLLSGEVFKLSLKDEAHGWYLSWILRDFGPVGLETALKATRLHLAYDKENGAKRIRLREIVASFESILRGESPADTGPGVDNGDARGGKGADLRQAWVRLRYHQWRKCGARRCAFGYRWGRSLWSRG